MKNIKNFFKKYNAILVIIIFLFITKFTCLIKLITGFPCPACGITRAYISLLHFRFEDAFNFNPLFWFIPPIVLFIIISEKPLFHSPKKQFLFFTIVFLIILSVYLYRMIKLFPTLPPMDYNKNSLLYNLFSKFNFLIRNIFKG